MNKKEATQELSDFLDFNQSDIGKLSSINPELVNAFEKLFNAVSIEYGSGEMFETIANKLKPIQTENPALPDSERIFKSGDIVVFLSNLTPPQDYPEAGQIVEIQDDVTSNFNAYVQNNQGQIYLANQWVSIKKYPDLKNPGKFKKSSDVKVMNEETGMPNIRMADPIEKQMWLSSPALEVVMIQRMFVPGDIVVVLIPGAKISSMSTPSQNPLLKYQIAKVTKDVSSNLSKIKQNKPITLQTQYVEITAGANSWVIEAIESVSGSPSIRLANTAEAALFDEKPVQEPVQQGSVFKVGDYIRRASWAKDAWVKINKVDLSTGIISGVDESGTKYDYEIESLLASELYKGTDPTNLTLMVPPLVGFKLAVKTIPEQLEYDIMFASNSADRQSPSQSAGDLYRNYKQDSRVMKMLKDTAFEGNDKKYWGLISRKNPRSGQSTFVWRKLVPQPKVVKTNVSAKTSPPKDLTLLSLAELAAKLKDVQDAIKFFEVQDPEYKELWEEMTRMQYEQKIRV